MRFAHYLRPNEKNEIPSQFIVVDTETKPEKMPDWSERDHLWFGWAVYQRSRRRGDWCEPEWSRFETREQFWQWVLTKVRAKTTLYIFCHNTSFDLPVLGAFTVTKRLGLKLKMAIIDAPPTILKWETGKATIKCLDTLNFWRMPLFKLAESIGYEKLPMPAEEAPQHDWDSYCRQDCEILRRALLAWWEFLTEEGLGNFRPTLASQAMGTFKHRYMTDKILVHTRDDVLALERAAYHGGRCDCFRVGRYTGEFTLLDVNSMYPAVMASEPYPTRLLWTYHEPSIDKLRRALRENLAIADVTVSTETPVYPQVADNRLVFPVGRFRTVLTTNELRWALDKGEIDECHAIAEYAGADCFRRFVGDFYMRRAALVSQGDAVGAWHVKILMNSLYGKFGQSGRVWGKHEETEDETSASWSEVDYDTGQVRKFRRLAGLVQSYEEQLESAESCPAIAAHVCANARMLLWRYIEMAGRENVWYCDTDSLLVNRGGLSRLSGVIDAQRLGALKIEGTYQDIEIWGPKDYRFGDKVRHKGIRASAEQIAPNQWKQWQWSSLVGLVRSGQIDAPGRKPVTKTLYRRYTKGTIDATNVVKPLRIESATSAAMPGADTTTRVK